MTLATASFSISALLLSLSLETLIVNSNVYPCRRSGFPERRFKDGDVLLDGAAAHADARDELALLGEWRSAAHRTEPSAGQPHQREELLPRLHERRELGGSQSHQRGRVSFPLRQLEREGRRSAHAVLENDVAVNIDNKNGNRYFGACRLRFDAVCSILSEGE